MSRLNTPFFLLISLAAGFFWPQLCFSESIQDGLLIRENAPITLKDGSVIECERFYWLVLSAGYIQCDKGGRSSEITIDKVDIEKTFGPEIAKEYSEAEEELKKEYEKDKKKKEEDIDSVEPGSTPPKKKAEPPKEKNKPAKKKKETVSKKPVVKDTKKKSTGDSKSKGKKDTSKKKKKKDKKKKSDSKKK